MILVMVQIGQLSLKENREKIMRNILVFQSDFGLVDGAVAAMYGSKRKDLQHSERS